MTPEEKYNKHMWYVLCNIKERSLFTPPGQKTLYDLAPNVIVAGDAMPGHEDEIALLQQLHAQKVIQLGAPLYDRDSFAVGEEPIDGYFLYPAEPLFSEWYEKYKNLNEPHNGKKERPKSIHEELYKVGKSVDEVITEHPQLKEPLERARKGIEAQREAMQRLYDTGVFREVERFREKMSAIANQMQPTLKLIKEINQSPAIKLSAEITPTIKNISVSLLGFESELQAIKALRKAESSEMFYTPDPTIQMAGDIAEMKESIRQLLSRREDAEKEKPGGQLDFNNDTSILYFAGEEILISKSADSDPHDLLRTIFKDRRRVWNAGDVLDEWQFDTAKKTPKKKVYHAGKAVNRAVAQETKIKDFLVITMKTVAINPKYLKD